MVRTVADRTCRAGRSRQSSRQKAREAGIERDASWRHLVDAGPLTFEERPCLCEVEEWIAGLNAEKKPVAAGQAECRDVEQRMIGVRQAVESKHPEEGGKRSPEDRHLERDGDKRRPTVQRPPPDVDG